MAHERLFRIAPAPLLENFSGTGSSYKNGARWNLPLNPVMYFGRSASVAALEMGNYISNPRLVPKNYKMGCYEVPSELLDVFDRTLLSDNWNVYPHPKNVQEYGTEWLQSGNNLGLIVPSAASPGCIDEIVIINPRHPALDQLKLVKVVDHIYNERLFSGLT